MGALSELGHLVRTQARTIHLAANDAKHLAHMFSELRFQNTGKVESPKDRSDMPSKIR